MNSARRFARRPSSRSRRPQQKQAFVRKGLWAERLEPRAMMAGDLAPFLSSHWNVHQPLDVNADGAVSPADALMIIDQLNAGGSRQLSSLSLANHVGEGETSSSNSQEGFLDVNNDGYLSPADALMVIDDLNAEGEPGDEVAYTYAAFLPGTNTPLPGNSVAKGSEFDFVIFVDDLRDFPDDPDFKRGVATAYVDVLLSDPSLISVHVEEVQQLQITGSPTGGTFRLSVDGGATLTDPIAWTPGNRPNVANDMEAKLQSEFGDADGDPDFDVTYNSTTGRYNVRFLDKFADQDVVLLQAVTAFTGGTAPGINITEIFSGDRSDPEAFQEAFRSKSPTPDGSAGLYQSGLHATNAADRWDDVGAQYITTVEPYPGIDPRELVRVRVNADNAGVITFGHSFDVLIPDRVTNIYSRGDALALPPTVPFTNIDEPDPIAITITEPISANPDTITLNEDAPAFTFNPITSAISGVVTDTDNQAPITALTITAVNGVTTATSTGTAITLPSGSKVFFGTSTSITYTPAANLSGVAAESFTYTITDGTNFDTTTVTVNLTAQNDRPINRIGGGPINNSVLSGVNGATEDTAFPFTGALKTLSVVDVDFAGSDVMQVTLSVPPSAGTLTLSTQTGLTFTSGASGQSSMTFTGTLANVNAALASLTYNPAAEFNGNAVLTITSNDLGVGGAGGPLSSTAANSSVTISVGAVNDAPVNTLPATEEVDENLPLVFSTANGNAISIADIDANGGNVRVTVTSADSRPLTPAAGSGAVVTNVTGGIQIVGTVSQVNAALNGLTYAAGAGPDTDVLTIVTSDLGNTGTPGPLQDTDVIDITINTPLRPRALNDSFTFPEGLSGNATVELDVLKFNQPALTPGKDLVNETVPGTKPFLVSVTSIPATQGSVVIDFKTAAFEDDVIVYTPPSADFFGTITFQYTMNDTSTPANNGPSIATVTLIVSAANDNPVAVDDPIGANVSLYTTNEDTLLNVSAANGVLANDFDVDNQQDTDGNGSPNVTQSLIAVIVSDAANGSVTLNQDGSFSYDPDDNFAGPTDTFAYRVQDGVGGQSAIATVTVFVNAVNDAPVANNDPLPANAAAYTMAEGAASLSVSAAQGVLANDVDVDTPLANLQASLVSQPAVGTGTISTFNPDGSFTYTPPNTDFNGQVTFTYKVNDGSADSNVATVTITVTAVNDAPVAVDDEYLSVQEDTATVLNITANDTDVDSTIKQVHEPLVDGPDHGTIVVNLDGSVTYTPASNYFGPDSFQYRVRDNAGAVSTNVATVTINVQAVNDRPVAVNDVPATGVSYTTTEDVTLNAAISVLANDTDAEIGTTQETDLDVSSFTQARDGGNVVRGTLSMDAETGLFIYTPPSNFSGTVTFTYFVTDGSLISTNAATVQIVVGADNDAPIAGDDSFTAIKDLIDQTVSVLGNDTDVENNALSVTEVIGVGNVVSGNNGPAVATAHGSVRLVNGSIKYTPAAGYSGPDSFDYTVSDGDKTDVGTVTVDVIAFIPKLISGVVFVDSDGNGKVFLGEAYTDTNANGVYDNGEAFVDTVGGPRDNNFYDAPEKLIQGVKVRLTGSTRLTASDPGTPITPVEVTTDVHGRYEFRGDATTQFLGVAPGEYFVTQIQPDYLSDGAEANNVVGSTATRNLASRVGDNQFQVEWDAQQSLVTGHLSGLDFGEAGINAASLADSSGMIQEVLASAGKNGFLLTTDLAGNSIWSWTLPGWSNLSKVQLILSSDLASATLRVWDAAHAGDINAAYEITIFQQPTYNDGNDTPPSGSLARFRILGRSSSGEYIIRIDGTAADFGLSLAAAAPVVEGEGESDMVDRQFAEAADEVFADEAWA